MRAMVVDDSRVVRLVLRRMLLALGHEVYEASSGSEALMRLAALDVDVALVDWHMDGMSGLDFIRVVRADPAHAGVRMVIVSGSADPGEMVQARDAGASAWITKPFDVARIRGVLAELPTPAAAGGPR